jgi:hypothetical protein
VSRSASPEPGTRVPSPAVRGRQGDAPPFELRPFRAAWWAPGPHGQTLAGKVLRPAHDIALERERWETPDGDFIDLDLAPEADEEAPVVLVLHGLEGSTRRRYVLSAGAELARLGMRWVGLNFRSCSGEPNRRARSYHSGETGDLAFVIGRLRERFPGRPMGALGFSLGGNVLLKFLGETGQRGPAALRAAVAISVPYDLAAGSRLLEASFMGRFYAGYFMRSLRNKVRGKARLLEELLPMGEVLAARTLWEFDDLATAPLHGFRDAAHYYASSSSAFWLGQIQVPTLLLQALDDPFLPSGALPLEAIRANPRLMLGLVPEGGHVGFVEGSPARPRFWAEAEGARYLQWALTRTRSGDTAGGSGVASAGP